MGARNEKIDRGRAAAVAGLVVAMATMVLLGHGSAAAYTLDQVRQRDQLLCGVSTDIAGFSKADPQGVWRGLNVDICRAVAAAVLGDGAKVQFVPLSTEDSLAAILSGTVDLLSMNLEWNLSLDTAVGITFAGVSFHDGPGFMVPATPGIGSVLELQNPAVCFDPALAEPAAVERYFSRHKLSYRIVAVEGQAAFRQALEAGQCGVASGDISRLAQLRTELATPENFHILPETIARKVLGPAVRQGDSGWFNIVRWVLFMLKGAEEQGLSSATVEAKAASTDPAVRGMAGLAPGTGKGLGLADDWVVRVISEVGNYGEIFSRNLGAESAIGLERDSNDLWNRGGLHYAPALD